jgi:hypothetical protein
MRWPDRRLGAGLAGVMIAGGAVGCHGGSASPPPSQSRVALSACPMTVVHHTPRQGAEASIRSVPWVAAKPVSSQIVGHLFYYAVPGVSRRRQRSSGLRMSPGGVVPGSGGAHTKILWIDYSGRSRGAMEIAGQRLDAPGEFHQSFSVLGPSNIDVPSRGCWRLTLHTRTTTASITLLASQ